MVQMDFLAANHVRIVGLCGHAHRAVIFVISQLSCDKWWTCKVGSSKTHPYCSMLAYCAYRILSENSCCLYTVYYLNSKGSERQSGL